MEVNALVAGMEELISRTVGAEIRTEFLAAPGLWPTLVDPNQLENALLNLCINARDAMQDGGTLTIATGHCVLDAAMAAAFELPPGDYLTLTVTDTGTGMGPDTIKRAFDPFLHDQADRAGDGAGPFHDLRVCKAIRRPGAHRFDRGQGDGNVAVPAAACGGGGQGVR